MPKPVKFNFRKRELSPWDNQLRLPSRSINVRPCTTHFLYHYIRFPSMLRFLSSTLLRPYSVWFTTELHKKNFARKLPLGKRSCALEPMLTSFFPKTLRSLGKSLTYKYRIEYQVALEHGNLKPFGSDIRNPGDATELLLSFIKFSGSSANSLLSHFPLTKVAIAPILGITVSFLCSPPVPKSLIVYQQLVVRPLWLPYSGSATCSTSPIL